MGAEVVSQLSAATALCERFIKLPDGDIEGGKLAGHNP
jgi:hypothetical protein